MLVLKLYFNTMYTVQWGGVKKWPSLTRRFTKLTWTGLRQLK